MSTPNTAPSGTLILIPSTVIDGARQLGYGTFIYPGQWPMRFRFAYVDLGTLDTEDDGEPIAGWDYED